MTRRLSAVGRGRTRGVHALMIAVVATVLALGLDACTLGSGYQYVAHRAPDGVDLYVKVPPQWRIFDTAQVLDAQNGHLAPTQLKQLSSGEWVETMSSRPRGTVKTSLGIGKQYPTAVVESRELSSSERDNLSISSMRSELLGTDPLTASSGFEVLDYSELTGSGGIHGIRMTVNITGVKPALTFGQVTAVDANTDYIFALGVGCRITCWGENAGSLKTLLDSWTVKEQSP
ncbi:MAG: hypothetical protein ACRDVP_07295 [Acidimicrobiales bacterium]